MWRTVLFSSVFLLAMGLEVAARAYYDAVVVEARGAGDDDDDYPVAIGDQTVDQTFDASTDCFLPKDSGPCRGLFRAFYYSPDTQSCENFIYSGCGGNKNRFKTRDDCERKCRGQSIKRKGSVRPEDECIPLGESCEAKGCRTAPKAQWDQQRGCKTCVCPPVTPITQAACKQPPAARGHCRALLPRWSYDQHLRTCREFQFGGCDGNKNNFPSLQACMRICSGI
ncbi:carboxypeptidase inhibitor SmCI-like [Ischnura elegans]|uniref:carboxypeptidase inhibitor SmCI-like n=1 Tax=Ischnura elegans TaxID=197161 RepID=UPI001ED87334|nr:carboxypeptidase inhibitor SmCI-like [Ischnura elegans]